MNDKRRHLDTTQRAMCAGRTSNLENGQQAGRHAMQNCRASKPAITIAEAAKMNDVSERATSAARVVINRGTPELNKACDESKISVFRGEEIARLPKPEQAAAIVQAQQPKAVKTKAEPVPIDVDANELEIEEC